MDELRKQVRRAQRRLLWRRFWHSFVWCLFVGLVLASIALTVPKIWPLAGETNLWQFGLLTGVLVVALLSAMAIVFFRSENEVDAAIEVDRRFGLKERVSSTLALSPQECESIFGRALIKDATRRIQPVQIGKRFRVTMSRWSWLPLLPASLVFGLMLFVPDAVPENGPEVQASASKENEQIKKSLQQVLKKRLTKRRKLAESIGLKETAEEIEKLERGIEELAGKDNVDRRKAFSKLNELARDIKKKRDLLNQRDQLRKQLGKLKNIKQGPAERLAKAMLSGDFKAASNELKKLQEHLKDSQLSAEEKKVMIEQMKQISEKISQFASVQRQAMDGLRQQIEQKKKAGNFSETSKLQETLDKLAQQMPQMNLLSSMAKKLSECSQCMSKGQTENAINHLAQLAKDLKSMQSELDELEMLEEALKQIAQAKNAMNCEQCGGMRCANCQGAGMGENPGQGLGEGHGQGDRSDEETDNMFYDSRVRAKPGKGRTIVSGVVRGPNVAGDAREQIYAAINEALDSSEDPLTGVRLPKAQRQQVQQYFEAFRRGKNAD